ncbi:MAG: acyl-ACP--UDP-N-acetylglucosamine O-acyltransferase [Planctomycetes bacterium]|nr:acyl-ACP--UDP-N-acetylglucosamine O-acyltransferase [Planctomycetota bacterium]
MGIHATAIVDSKAELGSEVEIGPYAIVEAGVRLGDRTRVLAHAHLSGDCIIGPDCVVHMGAVLGHVAQDRGLVGGGGGLTLGARNIVREYATIHRSSKPGKRTEVGDDNFLLGMCHIGHDCRVGHWTTIANGALLAGHVTIGDRAFISGNVVIHQFVKVGPVVMIGGQARVSKDVPPFMLVEGNSKVRGLNVVGMRRAGMTAEQRERVKEAHRILYRSGLSVTNAVARLRGMADSAEVRAILAFIKTSERGLCGAGAGRREEED